MTTTATEDTPPMSTLMVQTFLRDVLGRFDVSDVEVRRMAEDRLLIVDPEGEDLVYSRQGERA